MNLFSIAYKIKKSLFFYVCILLCLGCASHKQNFNTTQKVFKSEFYDQQFTGLNVVDAETAKVLYQKNHQKYFTPASNTKIFTLFSSLQLLGDSIPALKYIVLNDTLYAEGTGDPTFLQPDFNEQQTLKFLKQHKNIALHLNNFTGDKFGPGWAWEDYHYYFQPEISVLPLYGNVVTLYNNSRLKSYPNYFKDSIVSTDTIWNRDLMRNRFYFSPNQKDTVQIPFKTNHALTKRLLEAALQKDIRLVKHMPIGEQKTLYSVLADSVYKRMMIESDNFLAEQLLVVASSTLSDTLTGKKTITHILENQLVDLKQPPRWVDGSGLSRYNLFTPESMVQVLHKLFNTVPKNRLFSFFPAWGVEGTLSDDSKGNGEPYLYAKSGSMGNTYNLSGYLITKSGKTLIFSFMNNHFRHDSSEVKKQMQSVLEGFRDHY